MRIPELGFGGGPLGGLFEPLDDATAAAALAAAWDGGIRYYDTAPHYGIGHSERRMGEFLRTKPRDEFILSTKVGRLLVPQDPQGRSDEDFQVPATHRRVWDFSRDGVRRSVEDSLERMGLDRIDILYLHDAERRFDDALRLGYPALAELRAEGVVEAIGAGMYDVDQLTTLVRETDVDVVMLAGGYTVLQQPALATFLPACVERDVSVVAAGVFNSGILATSRPDPDAKFDYQTATPDVLQRAHRIADICESHGVTVPEAAIAFPLRHPAVTSVVLGMRTPAEVHQNLAAYRAEIPEELWSDLTRD
ncbi:D-threo-aldose 1-dehydrogenase [Kribbella steppae]|uniref:D-threo-aldose 1-dehydrogenase n=1 Tax=Kribbella steppae TaxID=2512223 RepID=A0A4R2GYU0_9ACTN|nr:aldo/keto reductase [Kribbella steppae]TCO16612.1 D-threo-aldose 1-dehydrogenase [Kribbella steppae]